MNELLNDTSWKKAHDLILEKYGKSLSYRALKLFSVSKASFYSHGDDLIIPLNLRNFDLGDIVINRGSLLNMQQKSEIVDLVKFLIEPKIYDLHLKKAEDNLRIKNDHSPGGKVIDLFKLNISKSKTLSQIIHLKSHTELNRYKVALKIHEMAEKNMFVHLDDIAASLKSSEDFRALKDLTIYVIDADRLDAAMLNLINQYIEMDENDGPLFLIGSSLPLEAVELKNWPSSLKKDLMGFYFDVDCVPLAQQTNPDILDLLFFKLDNEMT